MSCLFAVAAIAVAACSSSATGSKSSTTVPSKAQIEAHLLALSDMPSGWSTSPATTTTTTSPNSKANPSGSPCTGDISSADFTKSGTSATTVFNQGSSSLVPTQLAEFVAYSSEAQTLFSKFATYMGSCKSTTETTDGMNMTTTIGRMSFPVLGDETSAWNVSAQASFLSISIPIVMVRKGNYLIATAMIGGTSATTASFETITRTAVKKVSG